MAVYHIIGIVHPVNATLSLDIPLVEFRKGTIRCKIDKNHLFGKYESPEISDRETYPEKKALRELLQEEISFLGFVNGNNYEVEILEIVQEEREEKKYGIIVPNIVKRNKNKIVNFRTEILKIQTIYHKNKEYSSYLRRCFSEMSKAIRFPHDTGFHCYRAIESLRNFCGRKYNIFHPDYPEQNKSLNIQNEADAWARLCKISGANQNTIESWSNNYILRTRKRENTEINDRERQKILLATWDIVDAFLESEYKE